MYTNYIKNFDQSRFKHICNVFHDKSCEKTPLWRGTVYIGTKPLYIESHVKWLSDKIDDYFFDVHKDEHIEGAKELYILDSGISPFITQPDWFTTNVCFMGDNIYKKPDLIIHNNCIFLCNHDRFYISVTPEEGTNFYHLGENHLLMRLFNYIFDDNDNIVLHGAVVSENNYGVLITGLSGYGKSTLSAYCLILGMKFVGDDRIAIHKENNKIIANPIYTTISLSNIIDGIKPHKISRSPGSTKDVIVLDKSQISKDIKICAVIEPHKSNLEKPILEEATPSPILTRIITDYSNLSLLSRNINPLTDYTKIFGLLGGIKFYKMHLSNSIIDNAKAILKLAQTGGTNV